MGYLTSLSIAASIFLTMGFIVYRLVLARSNQPALNRAVIITLFISSFFAAPLATLIPDKESSRVSAVAAGNGGTAMIDIIPLPAEKTPEWAAIAVWIYVAGVAVTLLLTIMAAVRIAMIVRRGRHAKRDGYTLVTVSESEIIPCSWAHYMIVSEADLNSGGGMIALHERAHIDRRHWLDLVLARMVCVFQWYNPAAYLLQHELRMIHEYEADAAVLRSGADETAYQMMLLHRATGTRQFPLINNLNTSNLKKRIIMMKKPVSGLRRRISALAMIPAAILALTVIHTDAIASVLDTTSVTVATATETATPQKRMSQATVSKATFEPNETIPAFPGGMQALLTWVAQQLEYPKSMIESQTEGRVVVKFKVLADGSTADAEIMRSVCPEADAEAKRIVSIMPRWTPAIKDGKPVEATIVLPIAFKLTPSKSPKMSVAADDKYMTVEDGNVKTNITPDTPGAPAVFVDGKQFTGDITKEINPADIESMAIRSDDPKYPNKAIYIVLKKK